MYWAVKIVRDSLLSLKGRVKLTNCCVSKLTGPMQFIKATVNYKFADYLSTAKAVCAELKPETLVATIDV